MRGAGQHGDGQEDERLWVPLIWMYWTEVRTAEVMGRRATAFSLND
jgi:hypothetical protein